MCAAGVKREHNFNGLTRIRQGLARGAAVRPRKGFPKGYIVVLAEYTRRQVFSEVGHKICERLGFTETERHVVIGHNTGYDFAVAICKKHL